MRWFLTPGHGTSWNVLKVLKCSTPQCLAGKEYAGDSDGVNFELLVYESRENAKISILLNKNLITCEENRLVISPEYWNKRVCFYVIIFLKRCLI